MTTTLTTTETTARLAPPGGGRFDALIFDMGSTLLEFDNIPWPTLYRISVEAVQRRLKRLGHQPPDIDALWERFNFLMDKRRRLIREDSREYHIGPLLKTLVSFDGLKLRRGELSQICDAYYAPIRRAVSVYSEARPTLKALHDAGYTLGVLSNTAFRAKDHREELIMFGLWEFFTAAVFTSSLRHRKPHPEPFHEITRRLNVDLTRSLYIGDRQREDVQGPQAVGMTACLVRRPHRKYEEGLTQSVEINSLDELPALLASD
jgi:HAD superfamily hydrolase (TIGR01662 family)